MSPSWLLLAWAGSAATLLVASLACFWAPPRNAASIPRAPMRSLAAHLLVYPVFYGLAMETIGHADLTYGALLGGAHALLGVLATRRRFGAAASLPASLRIAFLQIAYGAAFGCLYVTP